MKFAGRDAHNRQRGIESYTHDTPATSGRRRGLLESSEPDGSWRHVGVTLFKTVAISILAAICWFFIPSFEGWSFGDKFPNGKVGFVPTILCLAFAVGGLINLFATVKSAIVASRR